MRKRFNTTNSFLDILFNILLGFFLLLMIALVLVNPPQKNGDIELKAEFLITVEWPGEDNSDVDVFVKLPSKEIVYYANKDGKGASLSRDDRGAVNDTIILSDGTEHVIKENWEHVAIRKAVAGTYIVNILMFRKASAQPTPVSVKIEKLNPYQLVYSSTIMLHRNRQEETVLKFKLDNNKSVIHKSNAPHKIAQEVGYR